MDKEQAGRVKRDAQRWHDYTTGNAYVVYYRNRTIDHGGRGHAYGKTPVDAVKRWYRGLEANDKHTRNCVRVVAIHDCIDHQECKAGKLLMGTQQNSFPH